MTIEIQKSIKADECKYNVICIEQGGTFDYYLQKVGYCDLMHVVGTLEKIALSDDYIMDHIKIAIQHNFWME